MSFAMGIYGAFATRGLTARPNDVTPPPGTRRFTTVPAWTLYDGRKSRCAALRVAGLGGRVRRACLPAGRSHRWPRVGRTNGPSCVVHHSDHRVADFRTLLSDPHTLPRVIFLGDSLTEQKVTAAEIVAETEGLKASRKVVTTAAAHNKQPRSGKELRFGNVSLATLTYPTLFRGISPLPPG